MKRNNKKGFTLAELLIVVAIIAVLTAIAIPVFTTQLEKSREATDIANVRSAYAEAVADYLGNGGQAAVTKTVTAQQKDTTKWETTDPSLMTRNNGVEKKVNIPLPTSGKYSVTVKADGDLSVEASDAVAVSS